jgi:hypothetical protein
VEQDIAPDPANACFLRTNRMVLEPDSATDLGAKFLGTSLHLALLLNCAVEFLII